MGIYARRAPTVAAAIPRRVYPVRETSYAISKQAMPSASAVTRRDATRKATCATSKTTSVATRRHAATAAAPPARCQEPASSIPSASLDAKPSRRAALPARHALTPATAATTYPASRGRADSSSAPPRSPMAASRAACKPALAPRTVTAAAVLRVSFPKGPFKGRAERSRRRRRTMAALIRAQS